MLCHPSKTPETLVSQPAHTACNEYDPLRQRSPSTIVIYLGKGSPKVHLCDMLYLDNRLTLLPGHLLTPQSAFKHLFISNVTHWSSLQPERTPMTSMLSSLLPVAPHHLKRESTYLQRPPHSSWSGFCILFPPHPSELIHHASCHHQAPRSPSTWKALFSPTSFTT